MIVLVDSGVANLASVVAALRRLGAEPVVSAEAEVLKKADRVILPGVGAAAAAMAQIRDKNLIEPLRGLTQPVLGICLGMQLLFEGSDESGGTDGLGILPGRVELLPASSDTPVPHMGWNQLDIVAPAHPLLRDVAHGAYVYYVHSYAAPVSPVTVASTRYGAPFTAVAAQRNFMGCQFHPERSGDVGSRILRNFLEL